MLLPGQVPVVQWVAVPMRPCKRHTLFMTPVSWVTVTAHQSIIAR